MAMIEQSERGVVLSKSLAWTVGVALVGAGLWVGTELSGVKADSGQAIEMIAELKQDLTREANKRDALAQRVRSTEMGQARQDERLGLILSEVSKISAKLDRMERDPR